MEIITTLDNIKSTIHTHSNKSILDNTTASFTTALKTKLDGIEAGANKTIVDTALSSTSTNPIQNKVINSALSDKQDKLVSGTNIKTINGNSLLGSGNITINTSGTIDSALSTTSTNPVQNKVINSALSNKQDKLVSGTNIKSINNTSILSSGNLLLLEPNTNSITTGKTGCWESTFFNNYGTTNACRIVYGTVTINKNSFHNQSITFAKSMPNSNYAVILTPVINDNTASREIYTSVYSRSPDGFVCNGHVNNTKYKITYLHYIAIFVS